MVVSQHHPFCDSIFHEINHPYGPFMSLLQFPGDEHCQRVTSNTGTPEEENVKTTITFVVQYNIVNLHLLHLLQL